MANQKNPGGRPMDEEKRQGGSKEQRNQHKPDKPEREIDPDKDRSPKRPSGRNA
jgi:hypothetical protein